MELSTFIIAFIIGLIVGIILGHKRTTETLLYPMNKLFMRKVNKLYQNLNNTINAFEKFKIIHEINYEIKRHGIIAVIYYLIIIFIISTIIKYLVLSKFYSPFGYIIGFIIGFTIVNIKAIKEIIMVLKLLFKGGNRPPRVI
jgi:multisubunit Na+/H+ antiporter MnhE subunit